MNEHEHEHEHEYEHEYEHTYTTGTLRITLTTEPKKTPPLSHTDAMKQARLLKSIADPIRLQILSLLQRHGGVMNVSEIVEHFYLAQPTLSHHLSILYRVDVITYRQEGLCRYYSINQPVLAQAYEYMRDLMPIPEHLSNIA